MTFSGDHDFGGYPPPPPSGDTTPAATAPSPAARSRRTVLTAAAVAAVVGGGAGAAAVAVLGDSGSTVSAAAASGLLRSASTAPAAKPDGSISAAAARIGPSVVTLDVAGQQQQDTGSGVIIRADGYVLTNNHVVSAASGGGTITVTLTDGRRASGRVVGADAPDDLAVVKVGLTGLTAATFGSSSALVVGQTVVAVGAPLGLSDTVTSGIVSDIGRPVTTAGSDGTSAAFAAIQTDAAINPGNSGGPLVNLAGEVIGINAAIATDASSGGLQIPGQQAQSGSIGIGFAIPSDESSRIAGELIATGKATHALMGLSVADAAATGSTSQPGATVKTLDGGGPAAKAGLKVGDVVTMLQSPGITSAHIDSAAALVAAVRSHAPGDTVTITYLRGSSTHTVQVVLGSSSK
ncbi:MAG: putative serine protease PepD [Pseudonocardiales bacterium]|nr:putative serine protease PepD [Pseudonocardiales bacterium]